MTPSAIDSRFLSFRIFVSPGHARRVVRDAKAAALVEKDHAAVAVQAFIAGRGRNFFR
jgi:hypothetical protein